MYFKSIKKNLFEKFESIKVSKKIDLNRFRWIFRPTKTDFFANTAKKNILFKKMLSFFILEFLNTNTRAMCCRIQ